MTIRIVRHLGASIFTLLFAVSCAHPNSQITEKGAQQEREQELQITLGGFIADHPEEGTLGGQCTPDYTRTKLDCDIYNGLSHWKLTEVSFLVMCYPYEDRDKRVYRVPIAAAPLTTEHISFRLGLQLPPDDTIRGHVLKHWEWTYGPVIAHREKGGPPRASQQ